MERKIKEYVDIYLGKYKGEKWSKSIRVNPKNLMYWTSWELGKPVFFFFSFLILLDPGIINPFLIVWFLEKFLGWENFAKHSRFINYVEYDLEKRK